MNFYDKFIILCNKKGVSPSKAAKDIGCSKTMVSNWKTRGTHPTPANLYKIAAYFDVPVTYFDNDNFKMPEFNLQLFAVAQERVLLDTFRSLDEVGKAKALVYISELAKG